MSFEDKAHEYIKNELNACEDTNILYDDSDGKEHHQFLSNILADFAKKMFLKYFEEQVEYLKKGGKRYSDELKTPACEECGCIGNWSCGYDGSEGERDCTLDSFMICPCCNKK